MPMAVQILCVPCAGADLGFENRGGARDVHRCSSVKCGAQIGHSQAKNGGGRHAPLAPPLDPRLLVININMYLEQHGDTLQYIIQTCHF